MKTPILIGAAGGEYMESVVVTEWRHPPGTAVRAGEVVAVVETAKAATEVEAPCDGFLTALCVQEGEEIAVTEPIGYIADTADADPPEAAAASASPSSAARTPADAAAPAGVAAPAEGAAPAPAAAAGGRILASPAARRLAAVRGLSLQGVTGTGPRGRIKLRDLPPATAPGPALALARDGAGAGAPLLLLHGFAADQGSWAPMLARLGRAHPLWRLDLPGHGASAATPADSFEALLAPVLATLDAQDAPALHLVGHSLGGAVAIALAARRPERVASACLIAPAGLGPDIDAAVLSGICRATQPESLAPWLRQLVAAPELIDAAYVQQAMARRSDPALRAAQTALAERLFPDGTQALDLRPELERLRCPVRLVWGRADRIIPWRHALAAPARAALHLCHGLGHMPQIEAPDLVAGILAETAATAPRSLQHG